MELTVNKAGRYALVWLTNAEKDEPKVMDSLRLSKVASGDSLDTTPHML